MKNEKVLDAVSWKSHLALLSSLNWSYWSLKMCFSTWMALDTLLYTSLYFFILTIWAWPVLARQRAGSISCYFKNITFLERSLPYDDLKLDRKWRYKKWGGCVGGEGQLLCTLWPESELSDQSFLKALTSFIYFWDRDLIARTYWLRTHYVDQANLHLTENQPLLQNTGIKGVVYYNARP